MGRCSRRLLLIHASALLAIGFALCGVWSGQALANDLTASNTLGLSIQSSAANKTFASAQELSYGQGVEGTLDYDNSGEFESYWYRFRTDGKRATYAVQLDAVDGGGVRVDFYDNNGRDSTDWENAYWGAAATTTRVTCSKSDLDMNAWYYIEVSSNYADRYDRYRITVLQQVELSSDSVALSQTEIPYDGTAKEPSATVMYNGAALINGVDYEISYSNNVNVGTASATITGKGVYSGAITKTFRITPQNVTPTIKLSESRAVFSNGSYHPIVTVMAGSTVVKPSDYTTTYDVGSGNVGTHKVSVTLRGGFTGTGSATYTVVPRAVDLTELVKGKKKITVKWAAPYNQITGYQIKYSPKKKFKKFKKATKTVLVNSNTATSKTIKKLKPKKKYYVKVRAYMNVNGKNYYSSWSAKKSVKTK